MAKSQPHRRWLYFLLQEGKYTPPTLSCMVNNVLLFSIVPRAQFLAFDVTCELEIGLFTFREQWMNILRTFIFLYNTQQ